MNEKLEKATASETLKPVNADAAEKVEALQSEIDVLQSEIDTLKDKNTRLLAEQRNIVERFGREQDTKVAYSISKFAKEILEVADVLQAGLENCQEKDNEYYKGMDMTLDKLLFIFKQHGISSIDATDKIFDPHLHEALTTQESDDVENGTILHVVQLGYTIKSRVLRPAKVIVSKKVSKQT
jgi:molecular chaperone GrpE